ncbi:hypothetical protein KA016_04095 [Candidatus Saccharibacteria bacterium]|jgi:hypothetical protein|nr:hypothetical protein [Candidatus Saccharibacteria bacterium]
MNHIVAQERINIEDYVGMYPESAALRMVQNGAKGWWEQVVEEAEAGILPPDGAIAAYYAVVHPLGERVLSEEIGPENARRLTEGTTIASRGIENGLKPDRSGSLASNAGVLLGHPNRPQGPGYIDYAKVDLAVSLTDRKNVMRVDPADNILIGTDKIGKFYERFAADFMGRRCEWSFDHVVETVATVHKLGVVVDTPQARELKTLAEAELRASIEECDAVGLESRTHRLTLGDRLRFLGVIAPEIAEKVTDKFARLEERIFNKNVDELAVAGAALLSPYQLGSISPDEKALWLARAKAELYERRLGLK